MSMASATDSSIPASILVVDDDRRVVELLTIALNASFFNAQRMLQEYMIHAYQGNHAAAGP